MTNIVEDVLIGSGLVGEAKTLSYNVHALRETVVQVFRGDEILFSVKIAASGRLRHEYSAMRGARRALGRLVPEPLALAQRGGFDLLLCRGVRHVGLSPRCFARNRAVLTRDLREYLDRSARAFTVPAARGGHGERLARILAGLPAAAGYSAFCERVLARRAAEVDRLPSVLQHGDFAVNNCGLADHGLVVFDWENFGEVTLPGFDICIFLVSFLEFDPARLGALLDHRRPAHLDAVVAAACESLGVGREAFADLVVLSLLEFLQLKHRLGYGDRIMGLVTGLLADFPRRRPAATPCRAPDRATAAAGRGAREART